MSAPAHRPPRPHEIVIALRWLGDLQPDDIEAAMHAAATADLSRRWPDLTDDEQRTLRAQAAAFTKSRLRAWKSGARSVSWLEVRALITGLMETMD